MAPKVQRLCMPAVHGPGPSAYQLVEVNHAFDVERSRTRVQGSGAIHGFSVVVRRAPAAGCLGVRQQSGAS